MTNLEKYNKAFIRNLGVKKEDLPGLKYRGIPQWDSIGHMDLMADLEGEFEIRMDTPDVLAFTSYEKGKEILAAYGVELEEQE
ncbi:MAG TPA: acyl carrier protein [Candidatus Eubacterium avistercoris]|uniref:Acyl carrier protein n=1 Tax=Candidatus Eubacterium avistercoris TaxID=2838567 RepID=A0A9D2IG41_9FIRM|nr:acyl carrier protein [Candidatus Eubacterium avistercoris]